MLTITETAAEALDSLVASAGDAPESAGLRISPREGADGVPAFALTLAVEPEPTDQVVDAGHVPVYVAAESTQELDDKVLDARVEGERVGFVLTQA